MYSVNKTSASQPVLPWKLHLHVSRKRKRDQNPSQNPTLAAGMSLYDCPAISQSHRSSFLDISAPVDGRSGKKDARMTRLEDTSHLLLVARTSTQRHQQLEAVARWSIESLRLPRSPVSILASCMHTQHHMKLTLRLNLINMSREKRTSSNHKGLY